MYVIIYIDAVNASHSEAIIIVFHASEMETGRVTGRVEILRPAGQTGQILLSCN